MRLVVLDRDGVINQETGDHICSPEEWEALPGSLEAITRLHRSGYRVVVVTNQSGLGRHLFDIEALHRIHAKLLGQLAEAGGRIDAIFFCPHTPRDRCDCRKPRPGLLLELGKRLRVSLNGVPVVGDSRRDLEAAEQVGARPILVLSGNGAETAAEEGLPEGLEIYPALTDFVDALLAAKEQEEGRPEE